MRWKGTEAEEAAVMGLGGVEPRRLVFQGAAAAAAAARESSGTPGL